LPTAKWLAACVKELIPEMKVAIIGAGNVGQALVRVLARAGHEVTLAGRNEERTRRVADELGARWASSTADAATQAELIVLAVPHASTTDVAAQIRDRVAGKVVIDVSNRMEPAETSVAEELAQALPGARVVKAFNTIFASLLAEPNVHGQPLDGFFATDDEGARRKVAALLLSIGFRPVHVGGLAAARQLEAMGLLNIRLNMATNGDWRSSFVLVGAPAAAQELPSAA
jgi:hypothetical protein